MCLLSVLGKPVSLIFIILLLFSVWSCGSSAIKTETPKTSDNAESDLPIVTDNSITDIPVSPADKAYQWKGRVDLTKPNTPVFAWSGAAVSVRLTGSQFAMHFGSGSGQNWFNIIVDDEIYLLGAKSNRIFRFNVPLDKKEHIITIFKRSESQAGKITFLGFSSADGSFANPENRPECKIAFLGDSITAGACNEDPGEDQWNDRSTHNFYNSYASITARQLNAEVTGAVNSGTGVSTGWNEYKAWEIWNRQAADPDSAVYPPELPAPEVFIINLGENDDSFTKANGQPFPEDFSEKYIQLVKEIRGRYPDTVIVRALGGMGMYGGKSSKDLNNAWQAAYDQLSTEDPLIKQFKFDMYSNAHPRVAAHKILADELTVFLNTVMGW